MYGQSHMFIPQETRVVCGRVVISLQGYVQFHRTLCNLTDVNQASLQEY
jgi:hypothetical protein